MPLSQKKRETLPVEIRRDASSGLPLLSEADGIFQLVLAYLALPYSVAEYGCGKKASLILEFLLNLGIPAYALNRGLIMERDMSPAALAETDMNRRPHALIADNPLYQLGDLNDPHLREMLLEACPGVEIQDGEMIAGPYVLHHRPLVQFVIARTHIFTELTFWDHDNGRAVRRVIDPTLHREGPFRIYRMRELLRAREALIFRAPLLGRFRLDKKRLTPRQQKEVAAALGPGVSLKRLPRETHSELVRRLTGAEPGSIGDPETWTYANNIQSESLIEIDGDPGPFREHDQEQMRDTGRAGKIRDLTTELIEGREARGRDVPGIRAELRAVMKQADVRRIVREDARWSEEQLEILADVAATMVYFNSLEFMARTLENGGDLSRDPGDPERMEVLRGPGIRLRRRLDLLAAVSLEDDGRIDARALRPGFARATIETVRQMNAAGLTAFVDRVGNVHGLLLDPASRERLRAGTPLRDIAPERISHGSHIDTVNDAGKFDGRLGVLSGVETAHVLRDLHHYYGLPTTSDAATVRLQVSAYIGEEMTFTGQGVSMPGSAAVAGRSEPEVIYDMRNVDGRRWGELLPDFLRALRDAQARGVIQLQNDLVAAGDETGALLAACSDPGDFYTPHTYERHIEQGPILDRDQVPIVMVGTIMGIFQEDFYFEGERAEAAALALNAEMRRLSLEFLEREEDVRVTVGILEGEHADESASGCHEDLSFALRLTLEGELNHAGATPTPDRRDPGVALARLAAAFQEMLDGFNAAGRTEPLRGLVGNVRLEPGTDRNVIPGRASCSLAVEDGDALTDSEREQLLRELRAFVSGPLGMDVSGGGEGVELIAMDEVSFIRRSRRARCSMDLRSGDEAVTARYRKALDEVCARIAEGYDVNLRRAVQQEMAPQALEETGQVLMMERSYGGSHNPRETEMVNDIARGCVLQIAVSRHVLVDGPLAGDFNLFREVEARLPLAWRERRRRFTSGALHDTCNIAARAREERRPAGLAR